MYRPDPTYINAEAIDKVSQGLAALAHEQISNFLRNRSSEGIEIESLVDEGDVTDTILGFAQAQAVDLIVMGTHGRHGLDHILLGSVTEKVLRKAHCPVLAVRGRNALDLAVFGSTTHRVNQKGSCPVLTVPL